MDKIHPSLVSFSGTKNVSIEVSTTSNEVGNALNDMGASVGLGTYMSDGVCYRFFCSTLTCEQVAEIAELWSVVEITPNESKTTF